MKIYVTRHGETKYNTETRICGRADAKLTVKGIEQAAKLGKLVNKSDIDFIIASPLKRALDTAKIVSNATGIPYILEENLMERDYGISDGTFEGTPGFIHSFQQFPYSFPEGETLLQVVQRVYNCIDDIKKKYSDKNVLIISHGGVCRVINSYFSSLSNNEFFEFNLGNCVLLEYNI